MSGFTGELGAQFVQELYPIGQFSSNSVLRNVRVQIKVGNVPAALVRESSANFKKNTGLVLAGFAVTEDGSIIGYVEIPHEVGLPEMGNVIDWDSRVKKAEELFRISDVQSQA